MARRQLEMWSKDEHKEIVIELFDEECFEIVYYEGNCAFATYSPQSHGEVLDLWFEIDFIIDEYTLTSTLNVNI